MRHAARLPAPAQGQWRNDRHRLAAGAADGESLARHQSDWPHRPRRYTGAAEPEAAPPAGLRTDISAGVTAQASRVAHSQCFHPATPGRCVCRSHPGKKAPSALASGTMAATRSRSRPASSRRTLISSRCAAVTCQPSSREVGA